MYASSNDQISMTNETRGREQISAEITMDSRDRVTEDGDLMDNGRTIIVVVTAVRCQDIFMPIVGILDRKSAQ